MGNKHSKSRFEEVISKLSKDVTGTYSYVADEFRKFIANGKDSMTIAIVGKTGVGKSRLVNALIGNFEAKEGNTLDPGTAKSALYTTTKHGVKVNIWDTPGVEDGSVQEESYLQQIAENIKDVDLLLYCVRMDDTRFRPQDANAIEKVIGKLGVDIWKNAMIVLTFANNVRPNSSWKKSPEEYFEKKLELYKDEHIKCLKKFGVEYEVDCVPAGDIGESTLPVCKDWLPVFWMMAFEKANERVKPAMLKANHERLKFPSLAEKGNKKGEGEIPVILNKEQEIRLWEMIIPPARRAAIKGAQIGVFAFGIGAAFGAAGGFISGVIQGLHNYYVYTHKEVAKPTKENDSKHEDGGDNKMETKTKPMIKPKPNFPKPSGRSSATANPDSLCTSMSTLHISNSTGGPPPIKPKPRWSPTKPSVP